MFLLLLHVSLHNLQQRWAHAERAVAFLPFERNALFSEPSGGIGFEFLHTLGKSNGRRKANQDMQMVGRASNGDGIKTKLSIDAPDVCIIWEEG